MSSFYVQNFGCRATQADGAAIEHQFEEQGLARADSPSSASIIVMNTCTVTASADQDARAAIRRAHRENPAAQIVVTGCYAQRSPKELATLPGVAQVIGNSHKHQLAEIAVSDVRVQPASAPSHSFAFVPLGTLAAPRPLSPRPTTDDQGQVFVSDIFAHTELFAAPVFDAPNERTRPNLKVQDGCDNRCSFCVIPYVRGQSRSLKLEQALREVNSLVAAGYRELVISGINLGRWGRDLQADQWSQFTRNNGGADRKLAAGDGRLTSLIRAILDHTSLERLRISSVEPMDWTDELIALFASSPRIAKHAHVPMQSGSDAVLRRMHRKYRPWHYREKVEKIRASMPTAAIGADVMVGFPGETDAEFDETRRIIEDLPLTYLHVFTYSSRPGTPAADMPSHVPIKVTRERNSILRELGDQKKLAFQRRFIGQTVDAITLSGGADTTVREPGEATFTEALTDNYLKVRIFGSHLPNQWVRAEVQDIVDGVLSARNLA